MFAFLYSSNIIPYSRIRTNEKTGSKSLKSKSTAVTGSTNSKSTTENLSKTNSATNLNLLSLLRESKGQPNLKETTDCLEEEEKNSSNKLEVVVEVNEIEQSEHSKSSGNNYQQPIIEENHETAEEIKLRLLHFKFDTDPKFTKSNWDFVNKLATHFLAKDNTEIEWTSFVNTVHNLFTQHIGKIVKKNKYLDIDEETREEYFLYILDYIYGKQFFEGEIFKIWKANKWRTPVDMNKLSMVTINKDKLIAEWSSISDKSLKNLINDNSNLSTHKIFKLVFDAVFKTLCEQNFWKPLDGSKIQKPKYLSNIQHFINQYSKSKEWSEDEKILIKSGKKLNAAVYNSLVEMKLISDRNNIVEFNQTEIKNLL